MVAKNVQMNAALNTDRINLARNEVFKDKVLITALQWCHVQMNKPTTDDNIKLKMKSNEIINQPDSYRDRLAWSVAAILEDHEVVNPHPESLWSYVADALDGLSGQGI